MNCNTCGLIYACAENVPANQYTNKHKLRRLGSKYLPKAKRPERSPAVVIAKRDNNNKTAAKAHKFLYVTIPAYGKRGIYFDDTIKQKIIWEYLKLRGLIIETISATDWQICFPARNFKCILALPFNEKQKNKVYVHCIVCDECRAKLMKYCIYCGDHKQKKLISKNDSIAKRILQLKWNYKCNGRYKYGRDILSAVSLFKYSINAF